MVIVLTHERVRFHGQGNQVKCVYGRNMQALKFLLLPLPAPLEVLCF